jgi:nucleotide sugar dehydrogenase
MKKKIKIGFIGQGWIGKNYADDFEKRGYDVIRYSLEKPYNENKDKIKECDIVFIAVPTPTAPSGFDDSIVRKVVKLVGAGKTAVIKSTLLPGMTESINKDNQDIYVLHSPEFLFRHTAAHDAANPYRNIVGVPEKTKDYKQKAEEVMVVLPKASFEIICTSRESELIKYGWNIFFYFKNIFTNIFYDVANSAGADWEIVRKAIISDPRIVEEHTHPFHKGGRGAGGDCLIKDFSAFAELYKEMVGNKLGLAVLESLKNKNIYLLVKSGKDIDLLKGVYGENAIKKIME